MASRGGRGGARGGRGGKKNDNQPSLGHLQYNDILAMAKEGTDVLYPPMELPETEWPSEVESRIARRYNTMAMEMKFTSCWIARPTKASSDIERYSDRFAQKRISSTGEPILDLASLHAARKFDKDLLPPLAFEAVFEKKIGAGSKRSRGKATGEGGRKVKVRTSKDLGDGEEGGEGGDDDNSESEQEDLDDIEEDEDYEDENDYAENYFDNGEDDGGEGGDALGGGGDEDGGYLD